MTSPNDFRSSPGQRPSSFDEWLQAFGNSDASSPACRNSMSAGAPRWPLADVLPVLPFVGAAIGLAAGLVFAIVRGIAGPGWLAASRGRRRGDDDARPA